MIIVGEKEQADGMVSIRKKGEGDLGMMTLDAFMALAGEEINQHSYSS